MPVAWTWRESEAAGVVNHALVPGIYVLRADCELYMSGGASSKVGCRKCEALELKASESVRQSKQCKIAGRSKKSRPKATTACNPTSP
jgi:hypothetical protein